MSRNLLLVAVTIGVVCLAALFYVIIEALLPYRLFIGLGALAILALVALGGAVYIFLLAKFKIESLSLDVQRKRIELGYVRPNEYGPVQAVYEYTKGSLLPLPSGGETISTVSHDVFDEDLVPLPEPQHPADLSECIDLSPQYRPHADELLSGRVLVIGTSGSGKSNTTAVLCEEFGRLGVPFVLGDTEDEYASLAQWLPNGVHVGADQLTLSNMHEFGRSVLDKGLQVVLNLASYDMVVGANVMVGLINSMRQWQEERPSQERPPCFFLLEEAVTWLPQNVRESHLQGTETLAQLQGTFFNDLVRKGRKRGLGLVLICQKIAEIDKRALQSTCKILQRQTEKQDLKAYQALGIDPLEAIALKNGEAFLITPRVRNIRVQIRRRHSPDDANTPGLQNLRRYQSRGTRGARPDPFGDEETAPFPGRERERFGTPAPFKVHMAQNSPLGESRDHPKIPENISFLARPSVRSGIPGIPENEPVAKPEQNPVHVPLGPDDLKLNAAQIAQIKALYPIIGNVRQCLKQIGVGNRYYRHAVHELKKSGLRKERA